MEDRIQQMNQEFQDLLRERRNVEEQAVKRLKEEGKWIQHGLDANCNNPVLKTIEKEFWKKIDQLKEKYKDLKNRT